jgi:molybdenum cofactor guanylyltransferase
LTGFLLVGGQGTRLGGHKATRLYKGQPLFSYALALLQTQPGWTVLLGRCPELAHLALPQWWEASPGQGPLGALVRALSHSPSEWNLVLAVDYPELSCQLLDALAQEAQPADDAVLPCAAQERHPLCGFYHRRAAPTLEAAFGAGERSVQRALQGLAVRWVDVASRHAELHNVNRPTDLR